MGKGGERRRTNLASCLVATTFLIFITIVLLILYFTLFKPHDPTVAVTAIRLPSFSLSNGTVNFTFSQYASVRNPNRAAFSHYDSSLQLIYSGRQIGFMFIPAGNIDAGRTQYMTATFTVNSFPIFGGGVNRVGSSVEMESRMAMAGRVRVLHLFTHHVEAKARCRVAIAVTDGSVLGFQC